MNRSAFSGASPFPVVDATTMTPCGTSGWEGQAGLSHASTIFNFLNCPNSAQTTDFQNVLASGFETIVSYVEAKSLAIDSAFPVADPYRIYSGASECSGGGDDDVDGCCVAVVVGAVVADAAADSSVFVSSLDSSSVLTSTPVFVSPSRQALARSWTTVSNQGSTTSSSPVASSAHANGLARCPPNAFSDLSIDFPVAQNWS
mmetsp:Transcript_22287/g.52476  ORF Transcript_22287/g.52476 Transcript_22287/m.52476 type:complete len:202 (-) Transcript_22287:531-1136(-)